MNGSFKLLDIFKDSPWSGALLLFVVCVFALQINLGREANFDELYHVLAAQGWLEHGEPRIAEGTYGRVLGFTILVAWFFDLFGVSLSIARQPSVIACALLVALVFCWSWYRIGKPAAWIIAILFATSPFLIEIAQFVRFYALQALAFCIGALSVYELVDPGRRLGERLVLGSVALVTMIIAYYLQPVTVIGVLGIVIWAVFFLCITWLRDAGPARNTRLLILFSLAIGCLAVCTLVLTSELGAFLFKRYLTSPMWTERYQDVFFFYHGWLVLYYPTLWTLIPILFLVAAVSRPRVAWFAFTIFIVALLLHSFATAKALRYIFYAIPFLFILWGIALHALFERVVAFVRGLLHRASEPVAPWLASVLRPAFWVALVGFMLLANAATVRSITLLADINVPPDLPPVHWDEVRPDLESWLSSADVVITNDELSTLFYLGRYDLVFSRSRASEIKGEQFARDSRTGRPVISDRDVLLRIMDCHRRGLIVSAAATWGLDHEVDMATAEAVADRSQPIDLPENSGVIAFGWDHEVSPDRAPDCPTW